MHTRPQQQFSGGNVASTYKRHAPRLCVGHCFGITLSEARRKLFDGVRGRRMTPDLANMAKPSAVTFL
jgi:hypothetical protein